MYSKQEPIVIWGAGAMGGTIAAYLIRAGHNIILVDNNAAHVDAINQNGLVITGPIETFTVQASAYLPSELSEFNTPFKLILLCTKALHTKAAAEQLMPFLDKNGAVVSVQNGLNEHEIASIIGAQRTIGCFVNFGADVLGPGEVHYAGRGAVVLGELEGEITTRLTKIHALFSLFEPNAIMTERIFSFLWGKLAYGALLFASALTNGSIVEILAEPKYRNVLIALGKEVCAVAIHQGIALEGFNGFNPAAFMHDSAKAESEKSMDDMVSFNQKSAKTHSGIWRDLAIHKRKTEVDQQLGVIVMTAKQLGIATPILEAVIDGIHQIENGAPLAYENLDKIAQAYL